MDKRDAELTELKAQLSDVLAKSKIAPEKELPALRKESTALVGKINRIKKTKDPMFVDLPVPYEKPKRERAYGSFSAVKKVQGEKKRKREEDLEDLELDTEVFPSDRPKKKKKNVSEFEQVLEAAGLIVDDETRQDLGIVPAVKEKKSAKAKGSPRAKKGDIARKQGVTLWESWSKKKPFHNYDIQK